jgi:voltage-gated potassium channel
MPIFLIARGVFHRIRGYSEVALLALAGFIVLLGAALFSIADNVSYGIGLYWAVTTATTVGYGDVTPHNTSSRVIAAFVMLTTIPILGAVFALFAGSSILNRMRRLLGMETRLPSTPYSVIYGTHAVIPRVLDELDRCGDIAVLVAPQKPAGITSDVTLITGDPTDENSIRLSEPARANRALIACEADADTLVVAVTVHALAPDLEVYALTQSKNVARALRELGVGHTLASDELVGHALAKSLETPQAGNLLLQLVDTATYRLAETPISSEMVSQPLSKARAVAGSLVLGIAHGNTVDLGVGDDPVLAADDRLIVLEALPAS